ncbi:hypothetical protein HHI36_014736 [Cryptolaemus montrouzieri]|uniref:Uncharacterized protein n=1 Tax=Cryptolaemus montrouzieri TaxID=559131 RepID=A0ABD2N4C3_9CUCU
MIMESGKKTVTKSKEKPPRRPCFTGENIKKERPLKFCLDEGKRPFSWWCNASKKGGYQFLEENTTDYYTNRHKKIQWQPTIAVRKDDTWPYNCDPIRCAKSNIPSCFARTSQKRDMYYNRPCLKYRLKAPLFFLPTNMGEREYKPPSCINKKFKMNPLPNVSQKCKIHCQKQSHQVLITSVPSRKDKDCHCVLSTKTVSLQTSTRRLIDSTCDPFNSSNTEDSYECSSLNFIGENTERNVEDELNILEAKYSCPMETRTEIDLAYDDTDKSQRGTIENPRTQIFVENSSELEKKENIESPEKKGIEVERIFPIPGKNINSIIQSSEESGRDYSEGDQIKKNNPIFFDIIIKDTTTEMSKKINESREKNSPSEENSELLREIDKKKIFADELDKKRCITFPRHEQNMPSCSQGVHIGFRNSNEIETISMDVSVSRDHIHIMNSVEKKSEQIDEKKCSCILSQSVSHSLAPFDSKSSCYSSCQISPRYQFEIDSYIRCLKALVTSYDEFLSPDSPMKGKSLMRKYHKPRKLMSTKKYFLLPKYF